MAKGIGNGFPMAAVVTTPKIAASIADTKYFNTYGGNPMACAAGMAVLEVCICTSMRFDSRFKTIGVISGD